MVPDGQLALPQALCAVGRAVRLQDVKALWPEVYAPRARAVNRIGSHHAASFDMARPMG